MNPDPQDLPAVQTRLWDLLEKDRIGMLGLTGAAHQHFQPMTAFVERPQNNLWFFAWRDNDLVVTDDHGAEAMFVFQGDHLYACIGGRLSVDTDRRRMEQYWSPMVAAWYPGGKDDPRLIMLRMDCEDAQVWLTEGGPMRYAWALAKARATGRRPDLGGQASLDLH